MKQASPFAEPYIKIMDRKKAFFGVFFVTMVISYSFLTIIDFVPEPVEGEEDVIESTEDTTYASSSNDTTADNARPEIEENIDPYPTSIHIDALDREVSVKNPTSSSIEALDAALLEGVVRHPDSADFEDVGDIFILGHSSTLPNVVNRNFQAFNKLNELTWGDTIRLRSADTEYIYRVERVYEAKASELVVPNNRGEARLILATCNTLGAKEDRFIVESVLINTRAL